MAQDGLPSTELPQDFAEKPLTSLLAESGMVKAAREAKDALGRNAVIVNGDVKGAADNMNNGEIFAKDKALYGRFFLVKLGKKKNHNPFSFQERQCSNSIVCQFRFPELMTLFPKHMGGLIRGFKIAQCHVFIQEPRKDRGQCTSPMLLLFT